MLLLLAAVSVAAAIDLTTFRQSYARIATSYASLNCDFSNYQAHSDAASSLISRLELRPNAGWGSRMTSDNADFSVGLHVDGNLDTKSIGDRTPEYIGSRYTESELETWPNVSWRLYLPGTDAFAEVNGSLLGRFWSAASDDTILHRRIHTWEGQTSVGGKLGYGRIRDAWSLARAVRITEILRQEGVLAREPSDDELRRLAGFISRAWKLFGAHELGSGYYYDSLNIYLIKSGALNATMPAYVLFRLSDDWPLGTHTRMFGWRVYAGMDGYLSGESYWNSENDSASAWNDLDGWGGSEVACEYARLFGLRTTLLAGMAYTPP